VSEHDHPMTAMYQLYDTEARCDSADVISVTSLSRDDSVMAANVVVM